MNNAILLISCPDRKGITASVTDFIYKNNGNIEHADQHIDKETNTFFMRIEWALKGFKIPKEKIYSSFLSLVRKYSMKCRLHFTDYTPKIAIFVSQYTHCLYDLLIRAKENQLNCKIPLIVSNHSTAQRIAKDFSIDFLETPFIKSNRLEQEKKQLQTLKKYNIDLIILARYMVILSPAFIKKFANRIINIHHSFLPAFAGSSAYKKAYKRGVKIIGATSHYVTEKLDQGPIIEQDTIRITHRDSLKDIITKGRDLERIVLTRAVKWHIERKILVYNNKTVIFD